MTSCILEASCVELIRCDGFRESLCWHERKTCTYGLIHSRSDDFFGEASPMLNIATTPCAKRSVKRGVQPPLPVPPPPRIPHVVQRCKAPSTESPTQCHSLADSMRAFDATPKQFIFPVRRMRQSDAKIERGSDAEFSHRFQRLQKRGLSGPSRRRHLRLVTIFFCRAMYGVFN